MCVHKEFQAELKNQFEGIDEMNLDTDSLNQRLSESVVELARIHIGVAKAGKKSKLSPATLALIKKVA